MLQLDLLFSTFHSFAGEFLLRIRKFKSESTYNYVRVYRIVVDTPFILTTRI